MKYSEYSNIVTGTTWLADTATYISGLTTPLTTAQVTKINTFIGGLLSGLSIASLSDFFDAMYILAGETSESSLRNVVKRSSDATLVNAPAFVPLEGFTGNGSDSYIDTNFNPYSHGSKYALNNCAFGVYIRTNISETRRDIGIRRGAAEYTSLMSRDASATPAFQGRAHTASADYITFANTDSRGMYIVTRNGADKTGLFAYKNKIQSTNSLGTGSTTAVPNYTFYVCARSSSGTAESFSNKQISFAFMSAYLDVTKEAVLYDSFQAYMTANGKQV